jgi:hypothetical protein
MKKIVIIFLLFGVFHSCKENMSRTVDTMEVEAEKEARQLIYTLGMINMTPDSLRSPEQKALLGKFERIVYEHCAIKNKRFEITISKEKFKTMGVPEIYYDMLKKDIEDLNRALGTSADVFPVEETIDAFKKLQDEYFAKKNKMD